MKACAMAMTSDAAAVRTGSRWAWLLLLDLKAQLPARIGILLRGQPARDMLTSAAQQRSVTPASISCQPSRCTPTHIILQPGRMQEVQVEARLKHRTLPSPHLANQNCWGTAVNRDAPWASNPCTVHKICTTNMHPVSWNLPDKPPPDTAWARELHAVSINPSALPHHSPATAVCLLGLLVEHLARHAQVC